MINYFIVVGLYSLVFLFSEIIYRKFRVSFLFSRKTAHILGSFVSVFLPYYLTSTQSLYIGVLFTCVLIISKKGNFFKSVHDKKISNIGEVVFPLGIALSAWIVWPLSILAYQGSCLVLGLSDGFAGYLGSVYGKKNYSLFKGKKTIEGSVIFFIFTLLIFYSYYFLFTSNISIITTTLIFVYVAFITFMEGLFSNGWDNLVIPIVSGLLLFLVI